MLILPTEHSSVIVVYYHSLELHSLQHTNVQLVAMQFGYVINQNCAVRCYLN
jgi:hypothetical protein